MKKEYIIPNCKAIIMNTERRLLLQLSVYDEETEIVGAKGGEFEEEDFDKHENVWGWK